MPIHDWTRVDSGLFHAFHQDWIGVLARALNAGVLPPDYFALREQSTRGPVPDVLTLELPSGRDEPSGTGSGLAVAVAPPRTRMVRHAEEDMIYVQKTDRIGVRDRHGRVVAMVEIVSPGNKASKNELRTFVEKTSNLIAQGVHLLVIDLFPPSKRDPQGIHKAIWDEFVEEDCAPCRRAIDSCSLRRWPATDGLRRIRRRRRDPARHAALPQAGVLRGGAARRNLSSHLE